jgi:hypothetical protein
LPWLQIGMVVSWLLENNNRSLSVDEHLIFLSYDNFESRKTGYESAVPREHRADSDRLSDSSKFSRILNTSPSPPTARTRGDPWRRAAPHEWITRCTPVRHLTPPYVFAIHKISPVSQTIITPILLPGRGVIIAWGNNRLQQQAIITSPDNFLLGGINRLR